MKTITKVLLVIVVILAGIIVALALTSEPKSPMFTNYATTPIPSLHPEALVAPKNNHPLDYYSGSEILAQSYRPDACHTYNLFGFQAEESGVDAIACVVDVVAVVNHPDRDYVTQPPIIHDPFPTQTPACGGQDCPPVVTPEPPTQEPPTDEPPTCHDEDCNEPQCGVNGVPPCDTPEPPTQEPPVVTEPPATEPPAVTEEPTEPPDVEPSKTPKPPKPTEEVHCNNGGGNGTEGCDASDNGNNDGDGADGNPNGNPNNNNPHDNGQHNDFILWLPLAWSARKLYRRV